MNASAFRTHLVLRTDEHTCAETQSDQCCVSEFTSNSPRFWVLTLLMIWISVSSSMRMLEP